jgi:hypothetical protein
MRVSEWRLFVNLIAARSRVEALTRELLRSWDETKGSWRDAKADEFEARFMSELTIQAEKTGAVLEKLDELLTRVRVDCE